MTTRNAKTAQELDHPDIVKACQKEAPKGYRPLRQFINMNLPRAIKRTKAETGLVDVVAKTGHYQLFRRKGVYKMVRFNEGCMVFGRGEPVSTSARGTELGYNVEGPT